MVQTPKDDQEHDKQEVPVLFVKSTEVNSEETHGVREVELTKMSRYSVTMRTDAGELVYASYSHLFFKEVSLQIGDWDKSTG